MFKQNYSLLRVEDETDKARVLPGCDVDGEQSGEWACSADTGCVERRYRLPEPQMGERSQRQSNLPKDGRTDVRQQQQYRWQWDVMAVSYLCQGGGSVIGAVCLSVCLSVCHSLCVQNYCKNNEPISLKLDVMTGPSNRKNWLTFGGDLVPVRDTDSGSLIHFPYRCGIGDFRRFISTAVTGWFSPHSVKWLTPIG